MEQTNSSDTPTRGRPSKVARVLEEYDMQEVGTELEQRWTAEEDRWSLRDLATYFNQQLLQQALRDANVKTLDGELKNIYRLLTDNDVTTADRTRLRRRLEQDGVDIDALKDDFVTYQAIRTYLKKYRHAEYTSDESDPLDREIDNIQQLRGRLVSVTEGKLDQLRNADELILGEHRLLVDVQVICSDCNGQFDVITLLERGGCNCLE